MYLNKKILSIVIPVCNQWPYTRNCLDSFSSLPLECELIIVDNGSSNETVDGIKKYLSSMQNLKVIRNETNLGFGAAVNQGFAASEANIIMFLNNDIKVKDKNLSWLPKICSDIIALGDNVLVGPTGGFVDPVHDFRFLYETSDETKDINYMSAWCIAATRNTWNKLILTDNLGPFDAKTFFAYFEDTDLSFRAKSFGMKFKIYPLPLVHIGRQTSKTLNTNKLYGESKIKFVKRWKSRSI